MTRITNDQARANCARAELRHLIALLESAPDPTPVIHRAAYDARMALIRFDRGSVSPEKIFRFVTYSYDRVIRTPDAWQIGFSTRP